MKKYWRNYLTAELIIGAIIITLTEFFSDKSTFKKDILLIITFVDMIALYLKAAPTVLKTILRWVMIFTIPIILQGEWKVAYQFLVKKASNFEVLISIIFFVIYIIFVIPLVVGVVSKVKWTIPRLVAVGWLMEIIFDTPTVIGVSKFIHQTISTGLLAAIAFVVVGCYLAQAWGFRFNPSLKFTKSKNFSYIVLAVLIIYGIWDVVWNDFGSNGNTVASVFYAYGSAPLKFTYNSFASAFEAGVLEEMTRYLNIIVLLYGLRNYKHRVNLTVLISAALFGLSHLSNWGWQDLGSTLGQMATTFAAGLYLALLYLYTGKLWLPMIEHFCLDFFIFVQEGGDLPGKWSSDPVTWTILVVSVIAPLIVYIWMMFGKRHLVLEENADRIVEPVMETVKVS